MAENTVDTLEIEVSADISQAQKELKKLNSSLHALEKYNGSFDSIYDGLDKAARAAKEVASEVKDIVKNYDDLVVAGKTFDQIISNAVKPKGIDAAAESAKKATIDLKAFGVAMQKATNYQEAFNIAREHGVPIKTAADFAQKHFSPPKQETNEEDTTRKQYAEWYQRVLKLSAQVKAEQAKAAAEAKRFREECEASARSLSKNTTQADLLRMKIEGLQGKLANALETDASSDRIASYVSQIQNLENQLRDIESGASSVAQSTNKTSSAFKKLANSAKGFVKLGISKAANAFRNSFAGINKQLNYFGAAIKNVLVYSTLSRMLGAITKAVQTGTNNLYQYSKIIDGKFAASMDILAASFQYFQNSIGAAIAPIINAFAPAIDLAVDKVVELLNAFNQMIAKLTGASSWTKAVKVPKEYAEAAGEAEKANKGLLASFDELNVIQSQSGGSSSKETPDYGSMFEEVPLDGYSLPDFVQQVKDKINEGDWRGVGETLGEKVNEITSSVNWAAAGENLGKGLQDIIDTYNGFMETVDWSGIGSGLGDALNNLMANVDFESAGAAFAQGWNALVELIHGFVTTTDWKAVGLSISGFINGWFDTVDWSLLGQTVSDGVKSLLEALRTAVQGTDWKSIGGDISEMINQIDWSGIFSGATGLLSDAVVALLDLIIGFIQGLDWYDLGVELYESITESIASIDFDGIASRLMEGIGSALAGLSQFLIGIIAGAWDGLVDWWKEAAFEDGQFTMQGLLDGIWEKIKNIGTWIKENVFLPFINGFKNVFGIHSPSTVMAEMGGYLIDGLLGGLSNTWNKITKWFTDSVSWVKTKLTGGFTDIKNSVVKIWDGLWSGVKGVINSMLGGVEKMANGIVKGINKMIGALNGLSFDVPDWVPGIGGETFGFNIREISEVKIPRLASGGVVTGPTFAQIGEYPGAASNPEIVAPQSVIYDTVVSANGEQERLLREQNSLLRQLLQKETSITLAPSAALGRVNAKSKQMYEAAAGAY